MIAIYEVGGHVRDSLLGTPSKDIDYAVEAESFTAMVEHLQSQGFQIFMSAPEFFTVRAKFPKGYDRVPADFVLCRRDLHKLLIGCSPQVGFISNPVNYQQLSNSVRPPVEIG